jgi:hypothetical protein
MQICWRDSSENTLECKRRGAYLPMNLTGRFASRVPCVSARTSERVGGFGRGRTADPNGQFCRQFSSDFWAQSKSVGEQGFGCLGHGVDLTLGYAGSRMVTRTRIVEIGNSRGIRVPKVLREQAQLPDEVELRAEQWPFDRPRHS